MTRRYLSRIRSFSGTVSATTDDDRGLEIEAHAFGQLLDSEDFERGVDAFERGAEPDFIGK